MQDRLMRIVDGWFQVFQKSGTRAEFQAMLGHLKQTLDGESTCPEFTPGIKQAVDERVLDRIAQTYPLAVDFYQAMWDGRWGPWELV